MSTLNASERTRNEGSVPKTAKYIKTAYLKERISQAARDIKQFIEEMPSISAASRKVASNSRAAVDEALRPARTYLNSASVIPAEDITVLCGMLRDEIQGLVRTVSNIAMSSKVRVPMANYLNELLDAEGVALQNTQAAYTFYGPAVEPDQELTPLDDEEPAFIDDEDEDQDVDAGSVIETPPIDPAQYKPVLHGYLFDLVYTKVKELMSGKAKGKDGKELPSGEHQFSSDLLAMLNSYTNLMVTIMDRLLDSVSPDKPMSVDEFYQRLVQETGKIFSMKRKYINEEGKEEFIPIARIFFLKGGDLLKSITESFNEILKDEVKSFSGRYNTNAEFSEMTFDAVRALVTEYRQEAIDRGAEYPWSFNEEEYLIQRNAEGLDAAAIAHELNTVFHVGLAVRKEATVTQLLKDLLDLETAVDVEAVHPEDELLETVIAEPEEETEIALQTESVDSAEILAFTPAPAAVAELLHRMISELLQHRENIDEEGYRADLEEIAEILDVQNLELEMLQSGYTKVLQDAGTFLHNKRHELVETLDRSEKLFENSFGIGKTQLTAEQHEMYKDLQVSRGLINELTKLFAHLKKLDKNHKRFSRLVRSHEELSKNLMIYENKQKTLFMGLPFESFVDDEQRAQLAVDQFEIHGLMALYGRLSVLGSEIFRKKGELLKAVYKNVYMEEPGIEEFEEILGKYNTVVDALDKIFMAPAPVVEKSVELTPAPVQKSKVVLAATADQLQKLADQYAGKGTPVTKPDNLPQHMLMMLNSDNDLEPLTPEDRETFAQAFGLHRTEDLAKHAMTLNMGDGSLEINRLQFFILQVLKQRLRSSYDSNFGATPRQVRSIATFIFGDIIPEDVMKYLMDTLDPLTVFLGERVFLEPSHLEQSKPLNIRWKRREDGITYHRLSHKLVAALEGPDAPKVSDQVLGAIKWYIATEQRLVNLKRRQFKR